MIPKRLEDESKGKNEDGGGGGDASLNSGILVCNSFQGLGRPSYNIKYVYKYILAYILWYG